MNTKRIIILGLYLSLSCILFSCKNAENIAEKKTESVKHEIQKNIINDTIIVRDTIIIRDTITIIDTIRTKTEASAYNKFIERNSLKNKTFFCRAVFEAPLYEVYNRENIEFTKQLILEMGFDNNENVYYNTFYNLIENYEQYTRELVQYLDIVINHFKQYEQLGMKLKKETAKIEFEEFLKNYSYKKDKEKVSGYNEYKDNKRIYYLEYLISSIQSFFENDKSFKPENFKEIRDTLKKKLPSE